ncbi:MAG: hypothetical protein PHP61_04500 [Candidatus Izemoplasmatales bacterium]|nr:hypothetical protein [Candidatus Izemoplasmatales bacterium]
MNEALKAVKKGLVWLKKETPIKIRHRKTKVAEILELTLPQNKEKSALRFTFHYYPQQENLSCFYEFIRESKKGTLQEKYSFMNALSGDPLPGISEEDQKRLLQAFDFELVDQKIKSKKEIMIQAECFLQVIQNNLSSLRQSANAMQKAV